LVANRNLLIADPPSSRRYDHALIWRRSRTAQGIKGLENSSVEIRARSPIVGRIESLNLHGADHDVLIQPAFNRGVAQSIKTKSRQPREENILIVRALAT
jgi:hypothetical protein